MKSKTSLFNKAIWKHNLSAYWLLWGGVLLYYLLTVFLLVYATVSDVDIGYHSSWEIAHQVIMVANEPAMPLASAFFALVIAMFVFSYLFTARNTNMMHTFPLNRKSLFVTNYVTGLLFLIVPHAVVLLLTDLYCMAQHISVGGSFAWIFLFAAGEGFFFYNLAVCVIMFIGNLAAAPAMYLIVNFLYFVCRTLVTLVAGSVYYGVEANIKGAGNPLTPIVYMTGHMGLSVQTADGGTGAAVSIVGKPALLFYALAAAALGIIAFIAYEKKQLETAGDVITVGWLKPIFRWGAAFLTALLGSVFFYEGMFSGTYGNKKIICLLTPAVLIGGLVFFLCQMLLDKTLRVFHAGRVRECAVFAVCVAGFYLLLNADLFGVAGYVPQAADVAEAQIDVYGGDAVHIRQDTPEGIEEICALHRQMADERKELEKYSRTAHQMMEDEFLYVLVDIKYEMADGTEVDRSYCIPSAKAYREKADSLCGRLEAYVSRTDIVLNDLFGSHYETAVFTGGRIQCDWEEMSDGGGFAGSREFSPEDAQALYEALTRDIEAGNFQKTSGMIYSSDPQEDVYENVLGLDFTTDLMEEDLSYQIVTWGAESEDNRASRDVRFNKYCTNLADTLVKLGIVDEKDLILD